MNHINLPIFIEKIKCHEESARMLARYDFSRGERSWYKDDIIIDLGDEKLNMNHNISVKSYLDEINKLEIEQKKNNND